MMSLNKLVCMCFKIVKRFHHSWRNTGKRLKDMVQREMGITMSFLIGFVHVRFNITGIGRGKGRGGTGRGRGHFQGRSNSGATSQPQLQLRGNTRASLETKESNNLFQEPIETGQISSYPRPSIEIVSSRNLDRSVYASPEAEIGSAVSSRNKNREREKYTSKTIDIKTVQRKNHNYNSR
ncbi:uncharacterized protein LOC107813092 isoform X2 [Nicotiana tabacum]|uniref:Uncharacterized protein LOC107813092 isoform X2 n=3 Tax=Nicotiana tabacum TaxID=4097 RepID=A0A1S4BYD5_TOBAC|nr:PREDICTED: uncharacterized protein LOC107813092 isoform X3 [Nicotiana tabacum]